MATIVRFEAQNGGAIRKYILKKRGALASDLIRATGPKLSPGDVADIERLIARQDRNTGEDRTGIEPSFTSSG